MANKRVQISGDKLDLLRAEVEQVKSLLKEALAVLRREKIQYQKSDGSIRRFQVWLADDADLRDRIANALQPAPPTEGG